MRHFFKELLKGGFNIILRFLVVFAIGTGAGAIACWYYNFPMIFSMVGGLFALGVFLSLTSSAVFD